jgi:nitrite reductase/ring-hydroxylating ferredoxin subunit
MQADAVQRFWVIVMAAESLPVGTMATIEHGDRRLALFNIDGTLYATDDRKVDPLLYLTDGYIEGTTVVCPANSGRFDVKSGRSLGARVVDDLRTYPVHVENGNILVRLTTISSAAPDLR